MTETLSTIRFFHRLLVGACVLIIVSTLSAPTDRPTVSRIRQAIRSLRSDLDLPMDVPLRDAVDGSLVSYRDQAVAGAATVVSCLDLLLQTYFFELSISFTIYVSLISVNCLLLARLEEFALVETLSVSIKNAVATGLTILFIVSLTGGLREMLAQGSLFDQAEFLFGATLKGSGINLGSGSLVIMASASGAFIVLGLVIAANNYRLNLKEVEVE